MNKGKTRLLGALITAASIASASYVTGVPGGWHSIGIVTKPKEMPAGEGPSFTAAGDAVENRCRIVAYLGEPARQRGRSPKETRIGA